MCHSTYQGCQLERIPVRLSNWIRYDVHSSQEYKTAKWGYLCSPPRSACSCLLRLQQQTCRTLRKTCSRQSPPAQLAVRCWSDLSIGGCCPTRARTRRSGYRSLVCIRPSFGRSRRSRRVFSGRQSSPLLLWSDRRKQQRTACRLDLFWKPRSFCCQICGVLRSSLLMGERRRKETGVKSMILSTARKYTRIFLYPECTWRRPLWSRSDIHTWTSRQYFGNWRLTSSCACFLYIRWHLKNSEVENKQLLKTRHDVPSDSFHSSSFPKPIHFELEKEWICRKIAHQYRIPRHLGNHHYTCTRTSPQCFGKRPLESSCACLRCTHPRLLRKW